MPLDLSHPRHILPFSPSPTLPPATESTNSKIDSPATSQPPIQGQRAIQLKLNDQVLAQLVELARTSGVNLERGKVQLDLRHGHQPAIVINGVSHPLTLNPEPANSEVLRLSPSSRDLQSIATITHKASITTDLKAERLAKASQNLKLSREKEEREKESKKAVLLDVAPSSSRSSSLNRGRPSQLASSPPSRTASPSNSSVASTQPKHPSRLTATSVKPPSSSFRIGKGVAPNAIRNKPRTNSSNSSSSSTSTPVASPPPLLPPASASAPTTSTIDPPHPTAIAPARQFSSSSNSSTNSESSKPLSSAISTSTIGTSPESLTLSLTSGSGTTTGVNERGDMSVESLAVKKAGGGGVMKGKESLKKEAKKNNGATAKSASSTNPTSTSTKGKGKEKAIEDIEDVDAEGEVDDEMETAGGETEEESQANAKKKRKLLNGLAVESSSRSSSLDRGSSRERDSDKDKDRERGRSAVPIKTVIKKVEKVITASEGEGKHPRPDHKKGDSSRGRDREREKEREKEKSKKRKKQETKRWYSSDSEDGEVKPTNGNHPRPPLSSSKQLPDRSAKPTIPPDSSFCSSSSNLAPPSDSSLSFHSIRSRFYELYAPYAVLHSRLTSIRSSLERGQSIKESPKELRSLAEECEKRRMDLEGQKDAMSRWKRSLGGKG